MLELTESISSDFCEAFDEMRGATGSDTANARASDLTSFLVGDILRGRSLFCSSLREGEAVLGVDIQVFRENIFSAPAPLPCGLTDMASLLSLFLPVLSASSISFAETNRAADIRFLVF